jgi:hypothetical protein
MLNANLRITKQDLIDHHQNYLKRAAVFSLPIPHDPFFSEFQTFFHALDESKDEDNERELTELEYFNLAKLLLNHKNNNSGFCKILLHMMNKKILEMLEMAVRIQCDNPAIFAAIRNLYDEYMEDGAQNRRIMGPWDQREVGNFAQFRVIFNFIKPGNEFGIKNFPPNLLLILMNKKQYIEKPHKYFEEFHPVYLIYISELKEELKTKTIHMLLELCIKGEAVYFCRNISLLHKHQALTETNVHILCNQPKIQRQINCGLGYLHKDPSPKVVQLVIQTGESSPFMALALKYMHDMHIDEKFITQLEQLPLETQGYLARSICRLACKYGRANETDESGLDFFIDSSLTNENLNKLFQNVAYAKGIHLFFQECHNSQLLHNEEILNYIFQNAQYAEGLGGIFREFRLPLSKNLSEAEIKECYIQEDQPKLFELVQARLLSMLPMDSGPNNEVKGEANPDNLPAKLILIAGILEEHNEALLLTHKITENIFHNPQQFVPLIGCIKNVRHAEPFQQEYYAIMLKHPEHAKELAAAVFTLSTASKYFRSIIVLRGLIKRSFEVIAANPNQAVEIVNNLLQLNKLVDSFKLQDKNLEWKISKGIVEFCGFFEFYNVLDGEFKSGTLDEARFDQIIADFRQQQMEALCMGLHNRLGKDSCLSTFFNPKKNAMGEYKTLRSVRDFLKGESAPRASTSRDDDSDDEDNLEPKAGPASAAAP